ASACPAPTPPSQHPPPCAHRAGEPQREAGSSQRNPIFGPAPTPKLLTSLGPWPLPRGRWVSRKTRKIRKNHAESGGIADNSAQNRLRSLILQVDRRAPLRVIGGLAA